jgi:hypothetical protein
MMDYTCSVNLVGLTKMGQAEVVLLQKMFLGFYDDPLERQPVISNPDRLKTWFDTNIVAWFDGLTGNGSDRLVALRFADRSELYDLSGIMKMAQNIWAGNLPRINGWKFRNFCTNFRGVEKCFNAEIKRRWIARAQRQAADNLIHDCATSEDYNILNHEMFSADRQELMAEIIKDYIIKVLVARYSGKMEPWMDNVFRNIPYRETEKIVNRLVLDPANGIPGEEALYNLLANRSHAAYERLLVGIITDETRQVLVDRLVARGVLEDNGKGGYKVVPVSADMLEALLAQPLLNNPPDTAAQAEKPKEHLIEYLEKLSAANDAYLDDEDPPKIH